MLLLLLLLVRPVKPHTCCSVFSAPRPILHTTHLSRPTGQASTPLHPIPPPPPTHTHTPTECCVLLLLPLLLLLLLLHLPLVKHTQQASTPPPLPTCGASYSPILHTISLPSLPNDSS